uniref:Guanylate kinase-like domain-containing protein n=1 Tax=Ditylenchus dipsaci TaxID=166011 RepID=A0A915EFT6_9BILA
MVAFQYFFNQPQCDILSKSVIQKVHQSAEHFIIPKAKFIQSVKNSKRHVNLLPICNELEESISQGGTTSLYVQQLHKILQGRFLQTLFSVYDGIIDYTKSNEFPALLQKCDDQAEGLSSHELSTLNTHHVYPFYIKCMAKTDFPIISYDSFKEEKEKFWNIEIGTVLEISEQADNKWMEAIIVHLPMNDPIKKERENKHRLEITLETLSTFLHAPVTQEGETCVKEAVFEKVVRTGPSEQMLRCILLVGPRGVGRNELKKKLVGSCGKYSSVLPCTSRKSRKHEVNGVDYNFMERFDMEEAIRENRFVEHGEYHGNLYGTTYDSVLQVMEKGKIPVMQVHPSAICKLRTSTFKPIIIFVKPPNISLLKQTRTECNSKFLGGGEYFSDSDFKQMIVSCSQLQQNYSQFFDAVVVNGAFEEAFQDLCRVLKEIETHCYIPENWVDWI